MYSKPVQRHENVSWHWLLTLRGWDSLTTAFRRKLVNCWRAALLREGHL